MRMPNDKGLAKVEQIYQNRDKRVRELKGEGKKILGYFCCSPIAYNLAL